MWEVSAVTDRVLSFVGTRRHLLFFYSYPQGIPTEPMETMLRRNGNDMVYEREMFLQECQREGIHFPATVHPYFLQGPTSYVPFTYECYSNPKQRYNYVRVGTKGKGWGTPKGSPTLNVEAQLSHASFHLEPKDNIGVP